MSGFDGGSSRLRNNPFARGSPSPSPAPLAGDSRSKPSSSVSGQQRSTALHLRTQSFSPAAPEPALLPLGSQRSRAHSNAISQQVSNTFTPQFIKSDAFGKVEGAGKEIEGENDFSGKRYVWLKDPEVAFVRGWVVEDLEGARLKVQCDNGDQRVVHADSIDKVNPAKFDKVGDMAELTHLNEASVVHNLRSRYHDDLIYTYSGLFLVTVNPYCFLPIYTEEDMRTYKGQSREDTKPHVFAMADEAFRNLVDEGENQSILVTGESGAGKTENTKKIIQYLAAVANSDSSSLVSSDRNSPNLSEQILRANPILEAFGNAQTVRNNNSSRFGKFIRIEFTRSGQIAGAFIDWYLLEKSRVVKINSNERNYHIFYQMIRGAPLRLKEDLLISGMDAADFNYTKYGNDVITGVSDKGEWESLLEAFRIMGFAEADKLCILKVVAAVLLLGNITVAKESTRTDQASLTAEAYPEAQKACHLLGIDVDAFIQGVLHPRVKAGREWVEKVQTSDQVRSSLDALAKGIYERAFGDLVSRINRHLHRTSMGLDDSHFIGVLDIAGFEIFEENNFEQLCINYTNEKLQQFFNHHMFVLEQEEYSREQIEWKFIDFGKDLQPTIDLIELPNPIGIFSCLDEDSVMPKATDKTFTEKMHSLWDRKSNKYRPSRLSQGFILTHYAAEVDYSTEGWLEKNKDPLNENVTRLLASSTDIHTANLFSDCADSDETVSSKTRVKKGLFRTVAQRHKEQLSSLMTQLHSTHPHFVRCILPNHKKCPKQFNAALVLDQLRCNGVLEGIRIARTGFPNRLAFAEFRQRYEVLCRNMPRSHLQSQEVAQLMLDQLNLDRAVFRVGLSKVFFRAGVLADLEEQRDALIRRIMSDFQSVARGFTQRRIASKRLYRAEATRIIQRNFSVYLDLRTNPWWGLVVKMKPLMGATQTANEVKRRDDRIHSLEQKMQQENSERVRLEEERRRTDSEIQRIQQTLEGERALALDKEEMLKRLCQREAELRERLASADEDQESLEARLDDIVDAKRKAETQADDWRVQLEQAGLIIERLESDRSDLQSQVARLDARLLEAERTKSARTSEQEGLARDKKMLESQLHVQRRKTTELEDKLLKTDQGLDLKLAASGRELQVSKKQISDLLEENRHTRAQLEELSSTSTHYEDLMRRKESEIALLKADRKDYETERKAIETEKASITSRFNDLQNRLRDVQAEADVARSQKAQIEREAADTKRILEAKFSADSEAADSRKMLQRQTDDLKEELYRVQADLSRERQSRDDVQMLSEHKLATLREDYSSLNSSKITIEKELYAQQDNHRRAIEARASAEKTRKTLQDELRKLRERYTAAESSRIEAQADAERQILRQANERHATLAKDLDRKSRELDEVSAERARLADESASLRQLLKDSDGFRLERDHHKERLERELVTLKGRLAANENDNKALLNKVQQKNLDIARSNSRAGDSHRSRLAQVQAEKQKVAEENQRLRRLHGDAQVSIASLEKQKEKLALDVEDLQHEIESEHKANRHAEKNSHTTHAQLSETMRILESEKQLKSQAQTNTKKLHSMLNDRDRELKTSREQLLLLHQVFNPGSNELHPSWETVAPRLPVYTDLAGQLQSSQQALRVANEKFARAESQIQDMRLRHNADIHDLETRRSSAKRHMLEELDQNTLPGRQSPQQHRKSSDHKAHQNPLTPDRRHLSTLSHDSNRSDRTVDTLAYNRRMDIAAELEEVQTKLQFAEMQNLHLQTQVERLTPLLNKMPEWSPSSRRVHKLEQENGRLHDRLDDSARKLSTLEKSVRSGDLSLRDIQARSHEEIHEFICDQENSYQSLQQAYNDTLSGFTEAKTEMDDHKRSKISLEVALRDVKSELQEVGQNHEAEMQSKHQLLQNFADMQITLDASTSRAGELESSLALYKRRADEYFSKLEQAEIAVLKASRAEAHARTQVHEGEETYATVLAERTQMDSLVEDLQRQNQSFEARVEDLATDLDGALQAKKRLQHELDDYRSQRAMDVEDKEVSMEQTRRKYQSEFASLNNELEIERENVLHARSETSRLRDELEELRSKWDDEVLNSSAWAKEKSRLEITMQDLSSSREEATAAHNEAQSKIVSLLSQIRNLRGSMDEASAERDSLQKEKRSLESRLTEAGDRLEDLARGGSPSMRNAAGMDREVLELKSQLAQQQDIAAAAVGKMRKADALSNETQKDIAAERETNAVLHRDKATLEKTVRDLQGRLVDLETKGFSRASQDVRFLNGRVQELEQQLESQEKVHASSLRSVRNVDRTVKDLQSQLERKEKTTKQLSDEIAKGRERTDRLLSTIEELHTESSNHQLTARRAQRDLKEEVEKGLLLERELDGWKGLRMERTSALRNGGSEWTGSMRGKRGSNSDGDGLNRMLSTTKGFL